MFSDVLGDPSHTRELSSSTAKPALGSYGQSALHRNGTEVVSAGGSSRRRVAPFTLHSEDNTLTSIRASKQSSVNLYPQFFSQLWVVRLNYFIAVTLSISAVIAGLPISLYYARKSGDTGAPASAPLAPQAASMRPDEATLFRLSLDVDPSRALGLLDTFTGAATASLDAELLRSEYDLRGALVHAVTLPGTGDNASSSPSPSVLSLLAARARAAAGAVVPAERVLGTEAVEQGATAALRACGLDARRTATAGADMACVVPLTVDAPVAVTRCLSAADAAALASGLDPAAASALDGMAGAYACVAGPPLSAVLEPAQALADVAAGNARQREASQVQATLLHAGGSAPTGGGGATVLLDTEVSEVAVAWLVVEPPEVRGGVVDVAAAVVSLRVRVARNTVLQTVGGAVTELTDTAWVSASYKTAAAGVVPAPIDVSAGPPGIPLARTPGGARFAARFASGVEAAAQVGRGAWRTAAVNAAPDVRRLLANATSLVAGVVREDGRGRREVVAVSSGEAGGAAAKALFLFGAAVSTFALAPLTSFCANLADYADLAQGAWEFTDGSGAAVRRDAAYGPALEQTLSLMHPSTSNVRREARAGRRAHRAAQAAAGSGFFTDGWGEAEKDGTGGVPFFVEFDAVADYGAAATTTTTTATTAGVLLSAAQAGFKDGVTPYTDAHAAAWAAELDKRLPAGWATGSPAGATAAPSVPTLAPPAVQYPFSSYTGPPLSLDGFARSFAAPRGGRPFAAAFRVRSTGAANVGPAEPWRYETYVAVVCPSAAGSLSRGVAGFAVVSEDDFLRLFGGEGTAWGGRASAAAGAAGGGPANDTCDLRLATFLVLLILCLLTSHFVTAAAVMVALAPLSKLCLRIAEVANELPTPRSMLEPEGLVLEFRELQTNIARLTDCARQSTECALWSGVGLDSRDSPSALHAPHGNPLSPEAGRPSLLSAATAFTIMPSADASVGGGKRKPADNPVMPATPHLTAKIVKGDASLLLLRLPYLRGMDALSERGCQLHLDSVGKALTQLAEIAARFKGTEVRTTEGGGEVHVMWNHRRQPGAYLKAVDCGLAMTKEHKTRALTDSACVACVVSGRAWYSDGERPFFAGEHAADAAAMAKVGVHFEMTNLVARRRELEAYVLIPLDCVDLTSLASKGGGRVDRSQERLVFHVAAGPDRRGCAGWMCDASELSFLSTLQDAYQAYAAGDFKEAATLADDAADGACVAGARRLRRLLPQRNQTHAGVTSSHPAGQDMWSFPNSTSASFMIVGPDEDAAASPSLLLAAPGEAESVRTPESRRTAGGGAHLSGAQLTPPGPQGSVVSPQAEKGSLRA